MLTDEIKYDFDAPFETHMAIVFIHAFARAIRELQLDGYSIKCHPKRYDQMYAAIDDYKDYMRQQMIPDMNGKVTLDQHKLSAVIAALIIHYKPIVYECDSKYYECNEFVGRIAFDVGLEVLISFQIPMHLKDKLYRSIVLDKLKVIFPFPDVIIGSGEVGTNLSDAFVNFAFLGSSGLIDKTLWVLSHIYYFLDFFSNGKKQMETYAISEYNKLTASYVQMNSTKTFPTN